MSKLSVHLTSPGNITGYGEFLRIPASKGNPVAGVYQLNINTKPDVINYSPTTKLVYRRQTPAWERLPSDMWVGNPVTSAQNWLLNIKENNKSLIDLWLLNPSDWYDPLNEPVPQTVAEAQWLNTWMVTALNIAHDRGLKLAMFSFSVGRPEYNLWPYFYESLRLGKQYGAILSLHEYGVDYPLITRNPDGSLTDYCLNTSLRHRKVYPTLPADCQVPIMITESACGNGYAVPLSGQAFVNDAIEYDKEIMKDNYVLCANLFQLGGSESNLQPVLASLATYISNTPTTTPPPPESADGTVVPPVAEIVDNTGAKWSLGAASTYGPQILKNGVQWAGGQGVLLLYYSKKLYTKNNLNQWFSATATSWAKEVGDPRPQESPNETVVPPSTQIMDSTNAVWTVGAPDVNGYKLLKNGVQFAGGQGIYLLYYNHRVFTVNSSGLWYSANATNWQIESGDPRTGESSNNTEVPPAARIIDSTKSFWNLGAQVTHGYVLQKNGLQFGGGQGVLLLYYNKDIYTKNDLGDWFVAGPTAWSSIPGDPRNIKTLAVPWVGQNTALATDDYSNSDCGPACVAGWLRFRGVTVTVDQVSQATGLPAGFTSTTFANLDKAANIFGLNLVNRIGVNAAAIRAELDANKPMIVLVYYPALPLRSDMSYTKNHWIIITGYSPTGFYYNDPYWLDERGKGLFMTDAQMMNAMNLVSNNGDTPYYGIIEEPATVYLPAKRGVGMGNLRTLSNSDKGAFQVSRADGFLAMTMPSVGESQTIVDQVRSINPNSFIIGRLFFSVDYTNHRLFSPQEFLAYCKNGLDGLYSKGVRYFQVHNEPNLEIEGMTFNWHNGMEFGNWLSSFLSLVRPLYPEAKWGYPGLSPQPNTEQFWTESKFAMDRCDWVGLHAYWQYRGTTGWGMESLDGGYHYKRLNTSLQKMLTEFSNNSPTVSNAEKGAQYIDYYRLVNIPAFSFALSWDYDSNHEGWVQNNVVTDIPKVLGNA